MDRIKSFIYLNNEKMYSLSSQMFEGLIKDFVESELEEDSKGENQKGPLGSGNILADVLKVQKEKTESKFLHDYLYTKFESELIEAKKIIDVNSDTPAELLPYTIVKVRGKMIFNDSEEITRTIREFNTLGETIAYMQLFSSKQNEEEQLKAAAEKIPDKNEKVRLIQKGSSAIKGEISKYAKEKGLFLEKEFLAKLEYALNYGLNGMLEVQLLFDSYRFSAVLDRNFLKEQEKYIVYKFSRSTEADITLVGIVTQSSSYEPKSHDENDSVALNPQNFKSAFRNMVDKLIDVENVFIGKTPGEVFIDPIALYVEI